MLEFFKKHPQLLRQLHHVRKKDIRKGRGRGGGERDRAKVVSNTENSKTGGT